MLIDLGAIKLSQRSFRQLPASVTILETGQIFIHTKVVLGQRAEKTIKLNIEAFSGIRGARASDNVSARNWVEKEPAFFQKLKEVPYIAKAITYRYSSIKTRMPKIGISMGAYSAGSLDALLTKPDFRNNRQIQFKALEQMAMAVNGMHRLHCTHGDLKPGNLLVNYDKREPDNIDVGLSDFGMAIDFTDNIQARQEAKVGLGTRGYQAPEVTKDIKDIKDADLFKHFEGLDRYSFGATVYAVLEGRGDEDVLTAFRQNNWREYSEVDIDRLILPLRGQVPAEVLNLLKRSLDKKPANRPSMQEWIPVLNQASIP